ncbi:MAG: OmpA family protein [Chitinophagaceae bacterium]|nr:OmpA family protein [Chitinophagaceae bacterium]
MAELQVEPRKKTSLFPWLLLILGLIALGIFLARRHRGTEGVAVNSDTSGAIASTGSAAVAATDSNVSHLSTPTIGDEGWSDINRNAPGLAYGEIHGKDIAVRGTDNYAVYDLGEDVLFDHDKSAIRSGAAANLKEVAASISQRFDKGPIRLYGFTDAQGSKAFNLQLAQARAEAVKQWLISNGKIAAERLSVEAKGEAGPKASNDSEQGRQKNRRVQIVVRKGA